MKVKTVNDDVDDVDYAESNKKKVKTVKVRDQQRRKQIKGRKEKI